MDNIDWYTTAEAAEKLNVTSGRVRQIVSKYKGYPLLVKQQDGRNLVSGALISMHQKQSRSYAKASAKKGDSYRLEDLSEGLHVASNGNHIQVFSSDKYEQFREELINARNLVNNLKEEKERRIYLEQQLALKNRLLDNTLKVIERSLDNINETLQNQKREQYLRYEQTKKDV